MKTEPVKDVLNSFVDWLPNDALLVTHNCKKLPVKDVLNSFIDWLPNDALLVTHNCKKFDANIIVSHYQNHDLINKLKEKVTGFSDTLPLFQQKIPNLSSYSQTSLSTEILRQTYDAHKEDATPDYIRKPNHRWYLTFKFFPEICARVFGTFRNEKGECNHVQRDGKRQNNEENNVRESCRKRSHI